MIVWRRLLRVVRWLCDVQPQPRNVCAPDGTGHYFGGGDRCQCGALPSSAYGYKFVNGVLFELPPPPSSPVQLPPTRRA